MSWRRWLLAGLAALPVGPVTAQDRPAAEEIGSWLLSCPRDAHTESCQLRHRSMLLPTGSGGPSAALEVIHRGGAFIPAVALRGLSTQATLGGLLALQTDIGLRFDDAPRIELACGLAGAAVICAPSSDAGPATAGKLAAAHSVLVQMRIGLPGGAALPEQARTLELQRTPEALARFRSTAPANESVPVVAGLDWRGMLDRLARDAGFARGLADLLPDLGLMPTLPRRSP